MAISKKFLSFLFILFCCSTQTYGPYPLSKVQLKFRAGDTGPSRTSCLKYKGDTCVSMKREVFDLRDHAARERLIAAKIRCFAKKKRWHICENDPGICRTDEKVTTFIGIPVKRQWVILEKILVTDSMQTLVDLNTRCAAIGSANYEQLSGE